jgi:hypothetical protein
MLSLSAVLTAVFGAELFHNDFAHFPPGRLSGPIGELNGAIQEYHYLPHRDQERVWIYTQDRPFQGNAFTGVKNDLCNCGAGSHPAGRFVTGLLRLSSRSQERR